MSIWLVVGVVLVTTIALRQLRAPTLVSLAVIGIVIVWIVYSMVSAARAARRPPERHATKNVTPVESALPSGRIAPRSDRDVVILDAADPTARLAEKLDALDRLRADGVVSDDEYETKRAQLIAEF
jgi:hypothetical protein